MIITRKWLEQHLNLNNISNDQISLALNSLGFEVEETCDFANLNEELVIGYVVESIPIEGTHLRFNKVNIGAQKLLEIVCGAANVNSGQFVIVAKVGTKIANGMRLDEREIRGYKSQGMICALNEIGLSNNVLTELEADSIYVINSAKDLTSKLGKSISEINFDDYIWDMDLTLNRSDALAATQLLKEISNYFKISYDKNNFKSIVNKTNAFEVNIEIAKEIEENVRTVAYATIEITNNDFRLEAKDDLWLKFSHSKATDNNFEQLANKAALESGQPVILLDANKIEKNLKLESISVDNKSAIALTSNNKLVNIIGKKTELEFAINQQTTQVIAVFLNFNPVTMRKQQKDLNLSNIDLQRYIKPLNPNLFGFAYEVLLSNLSAYGLVKKASEVKSIKQAYINRVIYELPLSKITDLLGINISIKEIKELFKYLDFEVTGEAKNLVFKIDPNRTDLYGQNDICEEVARLYGYDNILEQPLNVVARKNTKNISHKLQVKIGDYLIGQGFNNTKTYSLIASEKVEKWNLFDIKNPVKLMSPLSKLHETYRTNLISSLIDVAIYNSSVGNKNLKLWEVADLYAHDNFRERHLAFLVSGTVLDDKITKTKVEANYFYVKGITEAILRLYRIDLSKVSFTVCESVIDELHPYVNAEIKYENQLLGFIFELNPKFENIKKLNKTFGIELNINALEHVSQKQYVSQEFSKYQQSSRDISLVVSHEQQYQDLIKKLTDNVDYLIATNLIDEYQDHELAAAQTKSIAISFIFNAFDHQLTEAEINDQWAVVLNNANSLNAKVR
ncbi:phenylalanine--tRNA ligase subunit beta [Mesoplasma syrphidae]|uniref:Phenylalanine--tRNA ligase beta subunit n=1 Tax=Mesoplasma syrphidae TaxID=225999 RepID=A0A2K9C1X1_9MOLU|nr:phenylalanine--tRNA ligase subunit beta [Mesoplasma syrphidae]AUF83469.1 phenylalanine--tRNA ligase subunit beta [Mesoplasma syrphidae]